MTRSRCFSLVADATTEMRVPASCEIPTKSTTCPAAKRTRRAKGTWTARQDIPSDARRMRLPRVGRRGMYATSHGGGNRHVSREGGRDNRSILRVSGEQLGAACGEPAKQPCHSAQTGTVRETRAPPHTKRGQCANREHRPTPPEKDQNAQTEHLGMARSARRA